MFFLFYLAFFSYLFFSFVLSCFFSSFSCFFGFICLILWRKKVCSFIIFLFEFFSSGIVFFFHQKLSFFSYGFPLIIPLSKFCTFVSSHFYFFWYHVLDFLNKPFVFFLFQCDFLNFWHSYIFLFFQVLFSMLLSRSSSRELRDFWEVETCETSFCFFFVLFSASVSTFFVLFKILFLRNDCDILFVILFQFSQIFFLVFF